MSANPPLPSPVTPESIVALILPIIQTELLSAARGAMGGPQGAMITAILGSLTVMGPMVAAQVVAAQNTPATHVAMAAALAAADAAVAAEKAAGA